jgi:hypothetical protein
MMRAVSNLRCDDHSIPLIRSWRRATPWKAVRHPGSTRELPRSLQQLCGLLHRCVSPLLLETITKWGLCACMLAGHGRHSWSACHARNEASSMMEVDQLHMGRPTVSKPWRRSNGVSCGPIEDQFLSLIRHEKGACDRFAMSYPTEVTKERCGRIEF